MQYAVTPQELAPTDILGGLGGEGGEVVPHVSATLSVRYVGKPTYEFGSRASVRGFQYSAALPAFLSRMVGQSRVLMGDETVDEVEEETAAEGVAAGAAARSRGRARVPYLVRNAARGGAAAGGLVTADAGSAVAAASGFGEYADLDGNGVAAAGNLAASVGDAGVLRYVGGTEEVMVRGSESARSGGADSDQIMASGGINYMVGDAGL